MYHKGKHILLALHRRDKNILMSLGMTLIVTAVMYVVDLLYRSTFLVYTTYDIRAVVAFFPGACFAVFLLYKYIIKPRLRILSLILTSSALVTIAAIFLWYPIVLIGNLGIASPLPSFQIWESLTVMIQGFLAGAAVGGVTYYIVGKTHSIIPIIACMLIAAGAYRFYHYQDPNLLTYYAVVLIVAMLCGSVYFLLKHQIVKREFLKTLHVGVALFAVSLVGVSLFLAVLAADKFKEIETEITSIQELQLAEEKREEGRRIEELAEYSRKGVMFQDRKYLPDLEIAGYYQADRPLYLKTNVYQLMSLNDELIVNDIDTENWYYSKYNHFTDYSTLRYDPATGGTMEAYSGKINIVKIVYPSGNDGIVPTAEKIIDSGDAGIYNYVIGLMRASRQKDENQPAKQVQFIEYEYSRFDEQLFYQGKYSNPVTGTISFQMDYVSFQYPLSTSSKRIKNLALTVTSGASSEYEKAKRIETYLKENYIYSLTPDIQDQKFPIDDFLFDSQEGYCTHFATAMVVMLENLGVKARLVGGFYSDTFNETLDGYVMLNRDAHAWVEVLIPDYGWVTFDPTSPNLSDDTDPSAFTGGNLGEQKFSPEDIASVMSPLEAGVGFDDLFLGDESEIPGLETKKPQEISFSSEMDSLLEGEEAREREIVLAQQAEVDESIRERQEANRARAERQLQILVILFLSILGVIIVLFGGYFVYTRLSAGKATRRRKDILTVKKWDRKLRKYLITTHNLPATLLRSAPYEFLQTLQSHGVTTSTFQPAFRAMDTVLYGGSYTKQDIKRVQYEVQKVLNG